MNTSFDFFYSIHFPHILAAITIATMITIFALFSGNWLIIPTIYISLLFLSFYVKKTQYSFVLLLCILFSIGVTLQVNHLYQQHNQHQDLLGKPITVEGIITQIQNSDLAKEQTTILLKTTQNINDPQSYKHRPNILIYIPTKRAKHLQEHQTISIYNIKLQQPEPGCAYESYLIKENIWATAFVASNRIVIKKHSNPYMHIQCFNIFSSHLTKKITHLYNPLFLGKREKNLCTITIQHNSMYWGIAHHMARSGIHLVTVFGLFMTIFHYLRMRHSYRYFLGAILSIGYFEITFSSISFIRALFMILFQIFSKINKLTYSSIHALTLTTLIVLIYNPFQLLFLDFQLSFGITYIIIWLFQAKYTKTVAFEPKSLVRS